MAVHDLQNGFYTFADIQATQDAIDTKGYNRNYRNNDTPLVIDNGSWRCRVGWANRPKPQLVFRNVMARIKAKKGENEYTLVGNDISNIESLRSIIRTQFDRNVVVNFSNQEVITDHIFHTLGLGNEGNIHHPIVMTEPFCNPSYSRNIMSELLFEGYGVPAVCYGVDGLFSLYYDQGGNVTDGLVLNSGYQTTHIIPVINGRIVPGHSKRINIGGWHVVSYLQRLLQLRYPGLQGLLSTSRVQEIVEAHCHVSNDYINDLREESLPSRVIQFPFIGGVASSVDVAEQTEKDQHRRDRARQHLLRLSQRKREEKIRELEEKLEKLIHLQQLAAVTDEDEYMIILEEAGFTALEFVLKEISTIQNCLEVERSKLQTTMFKLHDGGGGGGGGESSGIGGEEETIDPQWIQTLYLRRKELLDSKKMRLQQRQELSKRRSAATQDRMRIISQLAEESTAKNGKTSEDTFGMDDSDWNVYRKISKSGGKEGSDSEKEETELREVTKLLKKYDPRSIKDSSPQQTIASHYQMKLGVELIRAPEILFQPPMVGIDQCGLSEAMELVINSFPVDIQQRLVNCVHVAGGNLQYSNIEGRLHRDLMTLRPFQSSFTIRPSADSSLGAWKGTSLWAQQHSINNEKWFTASQYNECGPEHWKEHTNSNVHI